MSAVGCGYDLSGIQRIPYAGRNYILILPVDDNDMRCRAFCEACGFRTRRGTRFCSLGCKVRKKKNFLWFFIQKEYLHIPCSCILHVVTQLHHLACVWRRLRRLRAGLADMLPSLWLHWLAKAISGSRCIIICCTYTTTLCTLLPDRTRWRPSSGSTDGRPSHRVSSLPGALVEDVQVFFFLKLSYTTLARSLSHACTADRLDRSSHTVLNCNACTSFSGRAPPQWSGIPDPPPQPPGRWHPCISSASGALTPATEQAAQRFSLGSSESGRLDLLLLSFLIDHKLWMLSR